ncbi:hypothetical protein [Weissella cibaria]|uniref:Uncharacterized protein n=1 Tax=Weissella cibaria TaxID=137591 RepID=A0A0D1LKE1_9LACO|nr:hypothetical protein [Weissella cibaria]ALI33985.1 hypothetical protein AO080_11265 [Weissella cibaria]KIU19017.1 hypothetical protein QX99_02302 [Weissella cibaria]KIU23122.1 hypothetical protein ff3pr_01210 [Weissella cibaria]MBD1502595.1 hypothetical protein [Weissella cibaria]MCG4287437.1 hypothetical protein [Weissella cibaria]
MQYTLLYEREPLFSNDDLDLFLADVELDADIRNIPFDEAKTRQLIANLAQQSEEPAIGFLATYPTYGHYDALGREIDVTLEIAVTHQD